MMVREFQLYDVLFSEVVGDWGEQFLGRSFARTR